MLEKWGTWRDVECVRIAGSLSRNNTEIGGGSDHSGVVCAELRGGEVKSEIGGEVLLNCIAKSLVGGSAAC